MISDALKLLRKYYNIKQSDMAARLGITPSHLSQIEKNKKPVSYELLEKYSKELKIPLSSITLFAEASEMKQKTGFERIVAEKALRLLEWMDAISTVKSPDDESIRAH